jgi:hypothetical protein
VFSGHEGDLCSVTGCADSGVAPAPNIKGVGAA